MKKDFDDFLCGTENFKTNEQTTDDRACGVNTDTFVLPTAYVNEIHINNVNKYVQKLAPEIQMNNNSLKDKKENQIYL